MKSDFGIFMSRPKPRFCGTRTLSCNLPMFVWDQKVNAYEDKVSGTTMSYWDDRCGILVDTFEEFMINFLLF